MDTPRLLPTHLSPSEYHRTLAEATQRKLAYPGHSLPEWQRELRAKIGELVGMRWIQQPPPVATTLWRRTHTLGMIEKIWFTSEPGADVVGYLCVPESADGNTPVIICLQGHTTGMHNSVGLTEDETGWQAVEGDRDFAIGAMRNGFAALCLEQRSFGERREQIQEIRSPHGCHDAAMRSLLLGRTLLGERLFDVQRGVAYLKTRPELDHSRVGVLGNSGGGTLAIYAAGLLPDIAFAMPSCSFCTFEASLLSIYHCADNYVPGILQWAEMADILGLAAPKPLVVVAGREDHIFPIAGVQSAYSALLRIYGDANASDRIRLVIGDGGHRFYERAAWSALRDVL